jgi:alpha-N-acetylglucosaminidase
MPKLTFTLIGLLFLTLTSQAGTPINGLLERIDTNASRKFAIEYVKSDIDFFELDQKGKKVVIRGNNHVSIATGIHWYLKYYAGIHLTWNNMRAKLPDVLPAVTKKERHETTLKHRYYLNYCTHSYSMAFWDWERWQQEIDWMVLHGINLPLTITGTSCVWRNVLTRLGYSTDEVNNFVAGPAFQAWWLMNNLEAWGGPNTANWYEQQEKLQKKILKRMREFGIEPVLPGYSGMVPNNTKEKLGLDVSEPGLWCGYRRPAILQPTDQQFQHIADLYYEELTKLYGKANYYSMDPFHEGGSVAGVDLDAAGKAIHAAMKRANPNAVWVAQAWQRCPYEEMIANLPAGDLIVLDLYSESRPQWGDPSSTWYRENGFGAHDWLYCMLLNYGGNVGLHGKMTHVINEFYKAQDSRFGQTLKGVGLTMEGIENNPVMYELLCELPWRKSLFTSDEWLKNYIRARYGKSDPQIEEAWELLRTSIYNCPPSSTQQGTHESIFCARPSLKAYQASSWSEMQDYYKPEDVIKAAGLMVEAAPHFKGNNNFEYDLVDIVRQAVAEKGRLVYSVVTSAYLAGEKELFKAASSRFLHLIELQDSLLGTRDEFRLGKWIGMARNMGKTDAEKDWLEWNARVQITTWGNRQAADAGGLRDYAHKEWNGLLKDFYYLRWKAYFDYLEAKLNGQEPENIDFYAQEEAWTQKQNPYLQETEGDATSMAQTIYRKIFH